MRVLSIREIGYKYYNNNYGLCWRGTLKYFLRIKEEVDTLPPPRIRSSRRDRAQTALGDRRTRTCKIL